MWVFKSNLNEDSQFTFYFAVTRTLCKATTSYRVGIIIRHVDIMIFFFSITIYQYQTTSILITTIHFVFNNL